MANEIRAIGPSGNTLYAHVINSSSRRWNGSSFEAYASANYGNYTIVLTEDGSSGVYVGDFPSGITDSGTYEVIAYLQQGASAAEGDPIAWTGSIAWDGSSVSSGDATVSGEKSASDFYAYVLRTFKRTDKSTEAYEAMNESIAEIRRKIRMSREETETSITDTIDTLGQYKLDLESDFGMFASDVFIRDSSEGYYLTPIGKGMFDAKYSKWGNDASERSKPIHYCVFGNQILLGPVPDKTSYTYVISYTKANYGAITSASTSVPYTKLDYREILKHGVLWRLFALVENDEQSGKYKALWDNGLFDIERKERRNRPQVMACRYGDV